MKSVKILFRNIVLLSSVFIVLAGSEQLYEIIESCFENSVHCDMDIESMPEDDLEDDVEIKILFLSSFDSFRSTTLVQSNLSFDFNVGVNHGDFSTIFGPPPDHI